MRTSINTNITILALVIALMSCIHQADGAGRTKSRAKKRVPREEQAILAREQLEKRADDALAGMDKILAEATPDEKTARPSRYGFTPPAPIPELEKKAPSFVKKHEQLINMLRSLLHIPYIVTLDSQNSKTIASSALVSALATDSRLLYELLHEQKNTSLLKNILWNLPKACGYGASAVYEYGRFMKSTEIAEKNKVFEKQLRSIKIQQTIQLILELCLRGFVYKVSLNSSDDGKTQKSMLRPIAEIADIVELWRLLSRYNTFFLESDQPGQAIKELDGQQNPINPIVVAS